ncbi:deoxyribose-phosphate aldolase [Lewinellaceae bacterium SD302]|nr:deoxyribose-phosphate aldolase [Lewinellaceae bacterium SD302]
MEINKTIDHTVLKPQTSSTDVEKICVEARQHEFCAVCVPPYFVGRAKQFLQGSDVLVATVIGFPYGYAGTMAKVEEVKRAVEEGADELDIVINLGALKSGDWPQVKSDIERVVTAIRLKGKVSKVIIESSLLSQSELARMVQICNEINPDFVKTSTGTQGGATEEVLRYLRANLKAGIKIKASGGIRDNSTARAMLSAGADRLGTSSGVALL